MAVKKARKKQEGELAEQDSFESHDGLEDDDMSSSVKPRISKESVVISNSSEYSYTIKIPKDRIAVLIGVKGKDKKDLEEWAHAKIHVDSTEGDVIIFGKDAIKLFELKEVIQAISRGFSPETAQLLMKPDYMLEIINLKDYGLDNPNKLRRVRARVIGTGGKARRVIEELTGSQICVYGKTIGIIGEAGPVSNAKRAVELLIKGSMHSTVYKWLEDLRRKAKREERGF